MKKAISLIVFMAFLAALTGCSKRMVIPGILTGVGAGAMAGGVAYRISLPEDDSEGLLGKQPQQKAGISILLFSGVALMLTGIIWSATTPVCEKDFDCWSGDKCEKSTKTCVPAAPGGVEPEKTQSLMPRYPLTAEAGFDISDYVLDLSPEAL